MTPPRIAPAIAPLVAHIEGFLARFYRFAPQASACDHWVSRHEIVDRLPDGPQRDGILGRDGAVVCVAEGDADDAAGDEVFMGVYLADHVQDSLAAANPLARVDESNLGAFLVAIEELSHFHLLANRLSKGRGVSQLELEWQGEVDKFLLAAHLIAEQYGDDSVRPLALRLFEDVRFTESSAALYEEANFWAARFWFRWLDRHGHASRCARSDELREALCGLYRLPWHEKTRVMDAVPTALAG